MLLVSAMVMAWVGIRTLSPSAAAEASRPSVRIPHLSLGAFGYIADPLSSDTWPSELLVIRDRTGKVTVFRIPMTDGLHALPDVHWWKAGWPCSRLEPDFATSRIRCHDAEASDWIRSLAWSIDGRFVGAELKMDDMIVATEIGAPGDEVLLLR
jgi:hypothetical protein